MKTLLALLISAATCAAQYAPIPAQPRPNFGTINGTRSFSSLSNLFLSVNNGDQVEIGPGRWTNTCYRVPAGFAEDGRETNFTMRLIRKTNVTVYAYGSTVYWTNYGSPLLLIACSNVTFRGLTFESERQDATNYLSGSTYTLQSAVRLDGTNAAIRFIDCAFNRLPMHGIVAVNGWTDGFTALGCRFLSVGLTNVPDLSNVPDGACFAGLWRNVVVENCDAYEVARFWEFERGGLNVVFHGSNVKLARNSVRRLYDTAFCFWPHGDGLQSVSHVCVSDNFVSQEAPDFRTINDHALCEIKGGTNYTLSGNTFFGATNDGVAHVKILQSDGTNVDGVKIYGNSFLSLSNGPYSAINVLQTAPYLVRGVDIGHNLFDSPNSGALWADAPNISFCNNTVRRWLDGNYAIRLNNSSVASSNLLVSANTFFSPSASSYLLYVYANTFRDGVKWLDNLVVGPVQAAGWTFATATQATNLFLRAWGTGTPQGVIAAGAGSQWWRTDTSTTGTLFVRTNTDGTVNGWRAMP
jgi:hypothetical protein